ncbi:protein phosphatase 2C domain-containing protein [Aeromonas veronii]
MSQDDIDKLRIKARQGDAEAQYNLGRKYYDAGESEKAEKWFLKAEKQNHPNASFSLAQLYENGWGVEHERNAIERYRRLESKHPQAQYRLGLMYEEGRGVEQNYCEAVSRYRQIESKHSEAQYRLGLMYEEGRGLEQNKAEALEMYSKASSKVPDAEEALKRLSSSPIESQPTAVAVEPVNPTVTAAPVISESELPTSGHIQSQPLQQSDANTTAQALPLPPKPESRQTLSDQKPAHDAVVCHDQETTSPLENPGDSNPLPQEPNLDTSLPDTSAINVDREEPVKTPEEPVLSSQWAYREPPEGAKWPKEHQDHKADRDAGLYLTRRRGRSHEHDAKFCDDDGDFWRHDSGWTVLAVADGAGSAEYSREGSRIAVTTVLEEFERWFTEEQVAECDACLNDWEISHGAFHQLFYRQFFEICKKAIAKIKILAEQNNLKERQFATTLLVSVSKSVAGKTYLASLWIGDGAMVAYRRGASRLLGSADSGAFVGQTRFLDASYLQQHYPSSVSIAAIEQAEALILMTDGVSDPKFKSDADLGNPSCWDQLWQELEPELAKDNPEQALLEWLHFFERGYHDDRTLLISLVQADKEQK